MKKISAIIIDTYPDKKFASLAIKMVQRLSVVSRLITMSDSPFEDIENTDFIQIPTLKSNNEYGQIIFEVLPEIITHEHVLVFQWDGFPLNPSKWKDEFLEYDYIGAPDGNWVGNGGFSIRSKKLLTTLKKLNISVDLKNPFDQPEDKIICTHKKNILENNGIRFTPIRIAKEFSVEHGPLNKDVFGFHGPWNLPIFFRESDLIKYADNIVSRIHQPTSMIPYLRRCREMGMFELLEISLENFHTKPNLLKTFQYISAADPNNELLSFFNKEMVALWKYTVNTFKMQRQL
jgi:hypothetical protein